MFLFLFGSYDDQVQIKFKKGSSHEQALARMIGDKPLKQLSEDVIAAFSKDGIRLE